MAKKALSIRTDVYERMVRLKKKDESFSELLRRELPEKKGSLAECAGLLADLPAEYWEKMEKTLADARKETNKRKIHTW